MEDSVKSEKIQSKLYSDIQINKFVGIAGSVLGLAALAKNGGFNLFGNSNSTPENININTLSGSALGGPTAFQAYSKECDDAIALTSAIYQGRIADIQEMQSAREIDVNEKFQL